MSKHIKVFRALALAAVVIFIAGFGCCEEKQEVKLRTVVSIVDSIDWVGSIMIVNWQNTEEDFAYTSLTLYVPQDVTIYKGTDKIDFTEINPGDEVTVTYYRDSSGQAVAKSISVRPT